MMLNVLWVIRCPISEITPLLKDNNFLIPNRACECLTAIVNDNLSVIAHISTIIDFLNHSQAGIHLKFLVLVKIIEVI